MIGRADTSAWTARHRDHSVAAHFDNFMARDEREFAITRERLEALTNVAIGSRVWRRALDVFELFARRGPLHHRQVRFPDLLVAAAAERSGSPSSTTTATSS